MSSRTLDIPGHSGEALKASIDWPAEPIRGYALFAHCFTCGKDLFAARQIARSLAGKGIACVRFDFTGVGRQVTQPEVAGFTHDIDDLLAVYRHLAQHYQAPSLLVGHSLGGAAVLAAAHHMPDLMGVVTIGAPYDPAHVGHLIPEDARRQIEAQGYSQVRLGQRDVKINQTFLTSIHDIDVETHISKLRKPLLVMHAPNDELVELENAAQIYAAAKHPKSFVSLDSADHLLTRREDALYAAEVIAAWASRYIPDAVPDQFPRDRVIVSETGLGKFQQLIHAEGHRLIADEPTSIGGDDTGTSPYGLLASALGACTSMTIRMYADRKKIALDNVRVEVKHEKVHSQDCADCETSPSKIDRFTRSIQLSGSLSQDQLQDLLRIADKCPVHLSLERSNQILTELV